jgi:hypothetical protein
MDRSIIYPGELVRDTDYLNLGRDAMKAVAMLAAATIGSSATIVDGLACTAVASTMQVSVAAGSIYSNQQVDPVTYGSLGTDTNTEYLQGINESPTVFTLTAPTGSAGQVVNYLIEAQWQTIDNNNVVLPYYNSTNPTVPLAGPNNSGAAQPTRRVDVVALQLKVGAVANLGSQVTPGVDSGWSPLWVITVAVSQTSIIQSNIAVADGAPFLGNKLSNLRQVLTGNTTYYVSPYGNDANGGLGPNPSSAFQTLQGAWTYLVNKVDLRGYSVTINVAAGTYAPANFSGNLTGYGTGNTVNFVGAGGTSTEITSSGGGSLIGVSNGAVVGVSGHYFTGSGFGVAANGGGSLYLNGDNTFGVCGNTHVYATSGGTVNINGSETITGSAPNHYSTAAGGQIIMTAVTAPTITLTGTLSFPLGFCYFRGGFIGLWNGLVSFPTFSVGGATINTTPAFSINTGGILDTNGAGGSLGANLPHSSSGGSGVFGSGTNGGFYS